MAGDLAFSHTSFFSMPMTIQWLMKARTLGKRLASLEPPTPSQLTDETHEVICGVAGCVVKKKKLIRMVD